MKARATVREGGQDATHDVSVLLDTGATVALATATGKTRLGLRVGAGPEVLGRSSSGIASPLFAIDEAQHARMDLGVAVGFDLGLLTADDLEGVDAIAPPQLFAPPGGAVRLDLRSMQLSVCNAAAACTEGAGWTELNAWGCDDYAGLVGFDVAIRQHVGRMLLDTGGSTLMFQSFFEAAQLRKSAEKMAEGRLVGSGASTISGEVAVGDWELSLRGDERLVRRTKRLWVAPDAKEGAAKCFPAGAVGLDLLEGCEIVLTEGAPKKTFLRCGAR